jgi:hypothetical protein
MTPYFSFRARSSCLIILLATGLCANPAFGWGPEGHRIVAVIAVHAVGTIAFTVISARASSSAQVRASATIPAFAAA